jgi:hypothetical protein
LQQVYVSARRTLPESCACAADRGDEHDRDGLSGHLVIPDDGVGDSFLTRTCQELQRRFGIWHVTLQIKSEEMEGTLAAHAP